MRRLTAGGLLIMLTVTGCGFTQRRWGACALGGAFIGGALGGVGGGLGVDKVEKPPVTKREIGAGIGGGTLGGAILGTLIGHALCDPEEVPPPPPAVAAPPPPAPAPPPKGTKLATVGEAFFDFDKADLKPSARDVLADAVKTLKDNPSVHVVVEGHTDSIGSEAYNQRLSERRAQAVKNYLVREGIDASRISTRGYGKSRPVASNQTKEGRAKNRRAEVVTE